MDLALTYGAGAATDQHWPAGILLVVAGLLTAVLVVARALSSPASHDQGPAGDGGLAALLGLLAATALGASGAGFLSTGELTVAGWGPFAAAGVLVLTPPTVGLLIRQQSTRRR